MGSSTSRLANFPRFEDPGARKRPLCRVCRAIVARDIQLPLQVPVVPSHGIGGALLDASIGTRRKILSRGCQFCSYVVDLVDILGVGPDEQLELRAFPFSCSWPVYAHAFAQHQIAKGHLPDACLFVCRKGSPPTNYDVRKALEARIAVGGLAVVTRSAASESNGERPPPLRPRHFSMSKAKEWVRNCIENHGELCGAEDASPRIAVRGMKVIDCRTLELKHTTAETKWIALSYVWRLAIDNTPSRYVAVLPTVTPESAALRLPDTIPSLIADAITVVRELGYNYLWVDRYCINQADPVEVREQIAQMDRIYRGADFTIVAASHHNGLAGVGDHASRPALRVSNLGPTTTLYETDPNPITEVRRSPWFSRGWTFQEAILSRRRLFFTQNQALFECATSTCCEMGDLGGKTLQTASHLTTFSLEALVYPEIPRLTQLLGSATRTNLPPDLQSAVTPLDEYLEEAMALLMLYRSKSLTVESDTLDAFAGVLKVFAETPYEFSHLQGVPYPRRHTNKTVDLVSLQQRVLALGLTWRGQGHRRSGFPSWSWAGWEAQRSTGLLPVGKQLGRFEGNFTSFTRVLQVRCKCGQISVPVQQVAAQVYHTPHVLALEGSVIPAELLTLKEHGNGTTYLQVRGPAGLSYDMENRFTTNMSAEDLLAGFTSGALVAFALGEEGTATTRSLYVLVVDVKDRASTEIVGERKDLMMLTRKKDFTKEDPFFDETVGLQAIQLAVS
ncbi:hypothetical protein OQA88_9456 [Cercophora sp. LCS_1]